MKIILLVASFCTFNLLYSQDCKSYYLLQNNQTVEFGVYNKRGDDNGIISYKVSNVLTRGAVTSAIVKAEIFDKTRKSINISSNNIKCENGVIQMDMKLFLPQQQTEQFSRNGGKAKNVYLEYPLAIKAGDKLKDGSFDIETDNNGLKQTLKMQIFNRTVTGIEKVTTPAGSWDCAVITYHTRVDIQTGPIAIPLTFEATEWFAQGFGIIKTVSKTGSVELVAIK